MFSFTRSWSRLRITNFRSRSRPELSNLKKPCGKLCLELFLKLSHMIHFFLKMKLCSIFSSEMYEMFHVASRFHYSLSRNLVVSLSHAVETFLFPVYTQRILWYWTIEDVSKQKPRQTVVVVLRGKIAAHMASIKTVKQTSWWKAGRVKY